MYLDKHFALRLDNACNRMDLQVHLRRFLNIWTKARATSSACKDALKELGRALDQKGRWHESETVIDLGLKEVAREERNAARDRVLLAGVGGLILTLVAGRLARKLFA